MTFIIRHLRVPVNVDEKIGLRQGEPRMPRKYPPGPRDGLLGITFIRRFRRAPLDFIADTARTYGGFAFVRLGPYRVYLVHRPDLVREVLVAKVNSFRKLRRVMRPLSKIEGNGLVVAEGISWRRHRPVVQPAFHASHFGRYARLMVEHTRRRLLRWSPGAAFDLAEEMNQLALEIIAHVVFDVDWSDQAARLRAAVEAFRDTMQREVFRRVPLPDWLPRPNLVRQRRSVRAVHDLLWQLIRERRTAPDARDDMLSLMLRATRAGGDDGPITDVEIRDEAATLFVAGHDTTSAALTWFWYLLARHPEVEKRVVNEVDAVLGDRPATFEDLAQLRYTEMAVKESMQLYPAAGLLFTRETVEDVDLAGYTLPRGSWVVISPFVLHRDPQLFPDPEVFDPERFAPGRADTIPPYAYVPFGAGPRVCIGSSLALMELVLVASSILQQFSIRLARDQGDVQPHLQVVFRPKRGLRVCLVARKRGAATAVS
jgi:cytochrome P450